MSDTKRYRVCEACNKKGELRGPKGGKCPDCGHGDCAPGVVDAGVVWSREWPTPGVESWVAVRAADGTWHRQMRVVGVFSVEVLGFGIYVRGDHDVRFAPLTIPAPPKE